MEFYVENRQTPIVGNYDVIVAGGGPAGIGAALAAARHGKSVLLIEQHGFLGGMWTAGMVIPIWDWENKGGIVQELVDGINAMGMNEYSGPLYTFDIEAMKLLLDRKMKQAGVKLLLHTYICDVMMDGDTIKGIIVENKAGRSAYSANIVIDCTGDGDAAARAGARFKMGRDSDGAVQPMSLMFKLGNMDYIQEIEWPMESTELFFHMQRAAKRCGLTDYDFNFTRPYILKLPTMHQGIAEMTHIRNRNPLNADDLTEAELEGRELVAEAMRFFTSYMPQFKNAFLEQTAPHIGIRESRRILGEYILSVDDIVKGARFNDGITICDFNVDIHQPDGKSQEGMLDYANKPYHIPYRSLVPLGVENLLVAGRCISGTFEAHASYRVTGDCVAMGQAAGTAAALCLEQKVTPRKLNGATLAQVLRQDGAKN